MVYLKDNEPTEEPMTSAIPEFMLGYLMEREAQRSDAVNDVLASLSDRERALVKDAAVMGYVQGMRHPQAETIPKDAQILALVIDACLAFPDLYRAVSGWAPETGETGD